MLNEVNFKVLSFYSIPSSLRNQVVLPQPYPVHINWHLFEGLGEWSDLDYWLAGKYPELINTEFFIKMGV